MPIKAKNFKLNVEDWVTRRINLFYESIEAALNYAGLNAVTTSRTQHKYTDRTGNLTSSVGYVIVHNGQILDKDFKQSGKGGKEGKSAGEALAKEVASEHSSGYQLIIVAGMPYAAYVEARGLDVLDSAEIQAIAEVKEKINDVIKIWQH